MNPGTESRTVESSIVTASGRSDKPPLPHIRELDGLRGIAAVMVFFHHLCFTDLNYADWGRGIHTLYSLSAQGMRGVDLFFVLSGFLITSLLIKDRTSPAYYRDFYWKRALRILPLYLLSLLAIWIFVPHASGEVLLSVFFLANFASALHMVASGPFWTLSIEEQFYLLWPTVVRRRSVAQLNRWALSIGLAAFALRTVAAAVGHHNYHLTFLRCDGLAAGAWLACWYVNRGDAVTPKQLGQESLRFARVIAIGVASVLCQFLVNSHSTRGLAFSENFVQTGTTLIFAGAIGLVIANTGSPWIRGLRSRLLAFFGLISYAMYMTHTYILAAYMHFNGVLPGGNIRALAIRFFTVLAITIAVSLAIRYIIELPAMSLRRLVLSRPAPRAEIESPLLVAE